MANKRLGKLIYSLRKEKGWTQEELANKSQLNIRSVQRIEAGKVKPRLFTLKNLSEVLGYDLLSINNEQKKPVFFRIGFIAIIIMLIAIGVWFSFFNNKLDYSIRADSAKGDSGITYANGNVKVHWAGNIIEADSIKTDQNSNTFETEHIKGKIFKNRLNLEIDESFQKKIFYDADLINKKDNSIYFRGNVLITLNDTRITSMEITLHFSSNLTKKNKTINVEVNKGVESIAIVFDLTGNIPIDNKYVQPFRVNTYNHFLKYKEHEAVNQQKS